MCKENIIPEIKDDTPSEIFNYIYRLTGANSSTIAVGMYIWKHYKNDITTLGQNARRIAMDLVGVGNKIIMEILESGL